MLSQDKILTRKVIEMEVMDRANKPRYVVYGCLWIVVLFGLFIGCGQDLGVVPLERVLAPLIVQPSDGAVIDETPTFRWEAVEGAVAYHFQLVRGSNTSEPYIDEWELTETERFVLDSVTVGQF